MCITAVPKLEPYTTYLVLHTYIRQPFFWYDSLPSYTAQAIFVSANLFGLAEVYELANPAVGIERGSKLVRTFLDTLPVAKRLVQAGLK